MIECDDGFSYVVKFCNNPQGGRKILINEFVSSLLLRMLGVHTPEIAVVNVDYNFIMANPEVLVSGRLSEMTAPEVGPHFGCLHVGGSVAATAFDFLPDGML